MNVGIGKAGSFPGIHKPGFSVHWCCPRQIQFAYLFLLPTEKEDREKSRPRSSSYIGGKGKSSLCGWKQQLCPPCHSSELQQGWGREAAPSLMRSLSKPSIPIKKQQILDNHLPSSIWILSSPLLPFFSEWFLATCFHPFAVTNGRSFNCFICCTYVIFRIWGVCLLPSGRHQSYTRQWLENILSFFRILCSVLHNWFGLGDQLTYTAKKVIRKN